VGYYSYSVPMPCLSSAADKMRTVSSELNKLDNDWSPHTSIHLGHELCGYKSSIWPILDASSRGGQAISNSEWHQLPTFLFLGKFKHPKNLIFTFSSGWIVLSSWMTPPSSETTAWAQCPTAN